MAKEDDLISVIIPVYKVEPYLRRCVNSVLCQTYSNIEVILVDDGSPDRCGDICDEYALADSRVKVIHKENGGLSDARNAGIEASGGEWLSFVDSDDFIEPAMLAKLYHAANAAHAQIAVCNVDFYTDEKGFYPSPWYHLDGKTCSGLDALKQIADIGLHNVSLEITYCKIYRRKLFAQTRFPVEKIHEDLAVAHLLLAECSRIATVEQSLYHYRQRKDSIAHRKLSPIELDYYFAFADRIWFYRKIGLESYTNQLQERYYEGINRVFCKLWPDIIDSRFEHYRKEALRILPLYLHNKEISVKRKMARLFFCFCPRYYKILYEIYCARRKD